MIKNVIVVDEHGKKYGTTYLKRAKGLVRQGRARFLTQNMLCLACPPNHESDNDCAESNFSVQQICADAQICGASAAWRDNMSDQAIEYKDMDTENVEENTAADNIAVQDRYSIAYCLEQIERIGQQTEYLNQVISELRQLENDSSGGQKAMALGNIVEHRETTNQQMLRFYEKMYDDLKGPVKADPLAQKVHLQEQLIKVMENTLENSDFSEDKVSDMFNGAFDAIRHIND